MESFTNTNGIFPDRRKYPLDQPLKVGHGDNDMQRNHQDSQPNGATSGSVPEVSDIDQLYTFIDENLIDNTQHPSIIGCTVSADKVQINIDGDKCQDIAVTKKIITQTIPEHLKSSLTISSETDSISLCCGVFGSGCQVAVRQQVQNGFEQARVTITGKHKTSQDCYALTIGHFTKKGVSCDMNCLCEAEEGKKTARCVEIHDNTQDIDLNRIKTQVYDMSLLKLDQQLHLNNQIKIQEKVFEISLYTSKLNPVRYPLRAGSKILIGCGRDNAALRSCIHRVTTAGHEVNLVYLKGDGEDLEILDGQCGSVVTLSEPCGEATIKAIAYLVGFDITNGIPDRKVAVALPLYGSLEKVHTDMRNILKDIQF